MTFTTTGVINDLAVKSSEQYVTFFINNETYGIEVLKVKEIVGMTGITPVPNSEKYLKGVINLRGIVVPVIDLRLKFNIPEKEYDAFTVILILEHKDSLVGVIVDSVSDVITAPGMLQEVPNFHVSIQREVLKGVLNKDDTLIIVLNPDIMLTARDIEVLSEIDSSGK
ncbi:MAG TPA: chemotaxis protein CheW [Spirochaetota bacterium]|nr:chemotaxis protein CheW [Spirochaetota bacterium]HQO39157.1 chemotaxis protein CheW [Spirochaetota bacterium]